MPDGSVYPASGGRCATAPDVFSPGALDVRPGAEVLPALALRARSSSPPAAPPGAAWPRRSRRSSAPTETENSGPNDRPGDEQTLLGSPGSCKARSSPVRRRAIGANYVRTCRRARPSRRAGGRGRLGPSRRPRPGIRGRGTRAAPRAPRILSGVIAAVVVWVLVVVARRAGDFLNSQRPRESGRLDPWSWTFGAPNDKASISRSAATSSRVCFYWSAPARLVCSRSSPSWSAPPSVAGAGAAPHPSLCGGAERRGGARERRRRRTALAEASAPATSPPRGTRWSSCAQPSSRGERRSKRGSSSIARGA